MDKLGLKVTPHPALYSIGWVRSGGGIKVNLKCTVPISIEKFIDVVNCDVLEMGACHILLGRPWEFNNQVIHRDKENIDEVKKGAQQFTLLLRKSK